MEAKSVRRDSLINSILFMKRTTPEQIYKVVSSGIECYIKAIRVFGIKSPVAKEALVVIKEMLSISKIEGKMLNFILENIESMDLDSVEGVVSELDVLNDTTYLSYDEVLGEIETACEMKKEERALRPNRGINSLLNDNSYKGMVLGLTKKMSDVKNFLNYEDEFWTFINMYLRVVPCDAEMAEKMCGIIPISDEEGNLCNFYTLIPQVVDLDTAMEAIKVLKRAHDLYKSLGSKYGDIIKSDTQYFADEYQRQVEEEANHRFK